MWSHIHCWKTGNWTPSGLCSVHKSLPRCERTLPGSLDGSREEANCKYWGKLKSKQSHIIIWLHIRDCYRQWNRFYLLVWRASQGTLLPGYAEYAAWRAGCGRGNQLKENWIFNDGQNRMLSILAHLEAIGCRWKREAPLATPPCWGSHNHLHQQNSEPANVSFQRSIQKPWKSHIQAVPETGNALYHLNNLSFRRHIAVRARTFSHRISHLKRVISNCIIFSTLVFSCQFGASQ